MSYNEKRDYLDKGKPVHRLSYCAFLDVLGFSERMRGSYQDGTENQLLERFHKILSESLSTLKENCDESMLYYKSFSDNVLLSHPQFSPDMESEFGFIMDPICDYQLKMALEGFFIRGGLALGPLFVDDNSVYGEALLTSYHLENNVAVNPMVMLCDKTKARVHEHITYYSGEIAPQLSHVLVDPDGKYFLNYLSQCIIPGEYDQYLDHKSVAQHKQQIENALRTYTENPAVVSKYQWLAAYHNYFCGMVSNIRKYDDSLKISGAFSEISFKRITKNK